jgi:hypothetical protein
MTTEILAQAVGCIESQAMCTTTSTFCFVGTVTTKAVIGKDRSDIAIEI